MAKKGDPRGGHMRLYNDIFDSPAWRVLDYSAWGLWLAMRRQLKGNNNGDIEATLGRLRHCGFNSPTTLSKGLRALLALGFIAQTRQGGIAVGQKICSLYRFTDEPTLPSAKTKLGPATNDWRAFRTLAEAQAALDSAEAAVPRKPKAEAACKNKSGLQKLYRLDTETVAHGPILDTETVASSPLPATETVAVKKRRTPRKPAPALEVGG